MDSRSAIKIQFMKEYARKDFPTITVKALCASTPVARTTFYSYFNNTDDTKARVGLVVGPEFEYFVTDKFSLAGGVLYSQQGAEIKDLDVTWEIDYLNRNGFVTTNNKTWQATSVSRLIARYEETVDVA